MSSINSSSSLQTNPYISLDSIPVDNFSNVSEMIKYFRSVNHLAALIKNSMAKEPEKFFDDEIEQISAGLQSWKSNSFRMNFDSNYQTRVSQVCKEYFSHLESPVTLELGSGFIVEGKNSYLASKLPFSIQQNLIHSDLNTIAIHNAHEQINGVSYIELNSTQITKHFSKSSLDLVIGSCFLDCLRKSNLEKTLEEAHTVLKDGGYFFHISDYSPHLNTILKHYENCSSIMFPMVNQENNLSEGIHLVPFEICEKFIVNKSKSSNVIDQLDATFLKSYISLTSRERFNVNLLLFQNDEALPLSNWVKSKFEKELTKIDNEKFFADNIKSALEKTNFKVLECGLVNNQEVHKLSEGSLTSNGVVYNDVVSIHGKTSKRKIDLPPDYIRKTSIMHVIVAQKIVAQK